ncbi:hypothetical protein V9T40_004808 [Parthenolecanium corni]|uniref:Uncharacterized protein n=1 Tax=Parthenolecanium corni TaxID=536013 RepID=A0AAN9Y3G0_9HEMI
MRGSGSVKAAIDDEVQGTLAAPSEYKEQRMSAAYDALPKRETILTRQQGEIEIHVCTIAATLSQIWLQPDPTCLSSTES